MKSQLVLTGNYSFPQWVSPWGSAEVKKKKRKTKRKEKIEVRALFWNGEK
jgi:hypothetical protein